MKIPQVPFDRSELANTRNEIHEVLVDVFGVYIIWCKDEALKRNKTLVASNEARGKIGRVLRETYEAAAEKFDAEQKQISESLQSQAIISFSQLLLVVLAGVGFDKHLGDNHVARFRLIMEVVDKTTGNCVWEEVINRNGRKAFMDYIYKWINDNSI